MNFIFCSDQYIKICRMSVSHNGGYEHFHVFCYIKPCSPLKALPSACFMVVSCFAYSSTLKMQAIYTSEASVDFQLTTRRCVPEDRTLQSKFVYSKDRCQHAELEHDIVVCRPVDRQRPRNKLLYNSRC
jgi:hypothetical protein